QKLSEVSQEPDRILTLGGHALPVILHALQHAALSRLHARTELLDVVLTGFEYVQELRLQLGSARLTGGRELRRVCLEALGYPPAAKLDGRAELFDIGRAGPSGLGPRAGPDAHAHPEGRDGGHKRARGCCTAWHGALLVKLGWRESMMRSFESWGQPAAASTALGQRFSSIY